MSKDDVSIKEVEVRYDHKDGSKFHPLGEVIDQGTSLLAFGIRSAVEHPYAFFKGIFHFGNVMVTTVQRVRVKTYFTAVCYDLVGAILLDRIAQAITISEK